MRHLWITDCRSLSDHLNAVQEGKVSDKRLGIELMSMRQQLWHEDVHTWKLYAPHGDRLRWTDTSTQIADALTKSMKPYQIFTLMKTGRIVLSDPHHKIKKNTREFIEESR